MLSVSARRKMETEAEYGESNGRARAIRDQQRGAARAETDQTGSARPHAPADRTNEEGLLPASPKPYPNGPGWRADRNPGSVTFLPAVPFHGPHGAGLRQCRAGAELAGDSRPVTRFF